MIEFIKKSIFWIVLLLGLGSLALSAYFHLKSKDDRIADLSRRLATSEETVEIGKNLYAARTHELNDLMKNFRDMGGDMQQVINQLIDHATTARAKIVVLEGLTVKWKKAYEGALVAKQTDQDPVAPGKPNRKRIEFSRSFGYLGVSGYTMTDPPEGHVNVEQLRPLRLGLAVTKNKDGTWSSIVSSSEDNVSVDVDVSGIDLSVVKPRWYQRLWVDLGADVLGDRGGSAGLSYRLDNWSLGVSCRLSQNEDACGPTFSYRIFK